MNLMISLLFLLSVAKVIYARLLIDNKIYEKMLVINAFINFFFLNGCSNDKV